MAQMLRIGLTGGIATGKSRVLQGLSAAGLHTLDLDDVAHEVLVPGGAAYRDVVSAFGDDILDAHGRIERRVLGERVFGDRDARRRLEAIVHPIVRREEDARAGRLAGAPGGVLVTDAALLIETGMHLRFRRLVVVECRPEQQRARLYDRGLTPAEAESRIDAQMPLREKHRYAHLLVDTSGTLEDTDRAADALASTLRGLAETRAARAWHRQRAVHLLAARLPPTCAGLDGLGLAEWLGERGEPALPALCALLGVSSGEAPWWRGAAAGRPGMACLSPAFAVWCALRYGQDPPWLYGATASVGWAVHTEADLVADALLLARAALHVLDGGDRADVDAWCGESTRWTGVAPSKGMRGQVVRAFAGADPETPVERMLALHPSPGSREQARASAALDRLAAGVG